MDIVLSQVNWVCGGGGGGDGGEAFCYRGSESFDPICSKIKCSLSPTSLMLRMKTALSDSMCEQISFMGKYL